MIGAKVKASSGAVVAAGAQFALSFYALHTLSLMDFGIYSMIMVFSQLTTGLWSALFCAPLPVVAFSSKLGDGRAGVQTLLATNLVLSLAASLLMFVVLFSVYSDVAVAIMFAAYLQLSLLRSFARAYAYVAGKDYLTLRSDWSFAAVIAIALLSAQVHAMDNIEFIAIALLAASSAGFLVFGRKFHGEQLRVRFVECLAYRGIWRMHSKWASAGVLSTEITGNAHAYILTVFSGASSFAPIAATALIIRPVGVVMNALSDYERPRIAKAIHDENMALVHLIVQSFGLLLMLSWAATAVIAVAVLSYWPHLFFPSDISQSVLVCGCVLWVGVAAIRAVRAPYSALLQSRGQFRPLAIASIASSGVTIIAVVGLVAAVGTVASIAGIGVGEAVCTWWVWSATRTKTRIFQRGE